MYLGQAEFFSFSLVFAYTVICGRFFGRSLGATLSMLFFVLNYYIAQASNASKSLSLATLENVEIFWVAGLFGLIYGLIAVLVCARSSKKSCAKPNCETEEKRAK